MRKGPANLILQSPPMICVMEDQSDAPDGEGVHDRLIASRAAAGRLSFQTDEVHIRRDADFGDLVLSAQSKDCRTTS